MTPHHHIDTAFIHLCTLVWSWPDLWPLTLQNFLHFYSHDKYLRQVSLSPSTTRPWDIASRKIGVNGRTANNGLPDEQSESMTPAPPVVGGGVEVTMRRSLNQNIVFSRRLKRYYLPDAMELLSAFSTPEDRRQWTSCQPDDFWSTAQHVKVLDDDRNRRLASCRQCSEFCLTDTTLRWQAMPRGELEFDFVSIPSVNWSFPILPRPTLSRWQAAIVTQRVASINAPELQSTFYRSLVSFSHFRSRT